MPTVTAEPVGASSGFSLVELLIAVSMLTVIVLASIESHLSSFSSQRASSETTIAVADLQAAVESLLVLPIDEIPVAGSEFEAGQPISRFADLHLQDQSIVATYPGYTPGGPVPNPLTIVVTIEWSDPKERTRRISVRTAKVR